MSAPTRTDLVDTVRAHSEEIRKLRLRPASGGGGGFSGAYGDLTGIPAAVDALDALVPAADRVPYFDGAASAALATLTAAGRSLIASVNAAAMLAYLGAEATANRNAANGYAGLDAGGLLPASLLPSSAQEFKGAWNAVTNTPALADGTGNAGDTYRVTAAASRNLGSGAIDFQVGDAVLYDGATWFKLDNTDAVASVFGRTGVVVAVAGDYTAVKITNTPAGNIAATDVQGAINELDTEKLAAADTKIPTQAENDALVGSYGAPSGSNPFVTDTDPRISAATPTLIDAILALDPALYWTLAAGGAGLTDQSGNGRNGTANGGVTVGGGVSLTADGAASTDFDGVDDKITSAYAPFVTGTSRTIVGWAQVDTLGINVRTLFAGSGANSPYLRLEGTIVVFDADSSAGGSKSWPSAYGGVGVTFAWALRFRDGSDLVELFIDGVSRGVYSITDTYGATPGNFQVAMQGASTNPFDGKISHVAVYEKALSDASITWLATVGRGRSSQRDWGLVSALPTPAIIGDRCSYIADSTNGVIWELIYDGQGTYPWKYVGGPALHDQGDGSGYAALSASAAWQAGGGEGDIVVPLAGDYDIEFGAGINRADATASRFGVGVRVGATDPTLNTANVAMTHWHTPFGGTGTSVTIMKSYRKTAIAASTTLALRYYTPDAAFNLASPHISATPVRVG